MRSASTRQATSSATTQIAAGSVTATCWSGPAETADPWHIAPTSRGDGSRTLWQPSPSLAAAVRAGAVNGRQKGSNGHSTAPRRLYGAIYIESSQVNH